MLLSFNMTAFQERFYLHEVELFLFAVICQMFFLVLLSPELRSLFLCTPHSHWIPSVLERPLPIGSHWIQHLWVFSQLVNHRSCSFVCIYLLFRRKRARKKVLSFCVNTVLEYNLREKRLQWLSVSVARRSDASGALQWWRQRGWVHSGAIQSHRMSERDATQTEQTFLLKEEN